MENFVGAVAAFLAAVNTTAAVAQSNPQSGKFRVEGEVLYYDSETPADDEVGEIVSTDIALLLNTLQENPGITTISLNSGGGGYYSALDMASIVIDFELDTRVEGECTSSCTYILLGGQNRTMARGSRIGFHHNSWAARNIENYFNDKRNEFDWDNPFEFASWLFEDTQQEMYNELTYMVERGVDARFAIETTRNRGDGMWYPRRDELLQGGVLTE